MKKTNTNAGKKLLASMSAEAIPEDLPPEEKVEMLTLRNACLQEVLEATMEAFPEVGRRLAADLKKKRWRRWSS